MGKRNLGKTSNNKVHVEFKSISLYLTYTPTGMSIKELLLEEKEGLPKSHNAKRLNSFMMDVTAVLSYERK